MRQGYLAFAPCSIQQRIRSRSSSVILVLLFCGIVLVTTTRCIILSFRFIMSCGVLYITPFGGAVNTSSVGLLLWQATQRFCTIPYTSFILTSCLHSPG